MLLAVAGGLAVALLARYLGAFGYALMVGVPFAIGIAVGFGSALDRLMVVIVALLVLGGVAGGLIAMHVAGVLCGLISAGILIGPVLIGGLVGWVLRRKLAGTKAARYPGVSIVLLFSLTSGALWLEDRVTPEAPIEIVRSERVLPMDPSNAWASLVFYEEVRHDPPWLARFGLPHPQFTSGHITGAGDVKTCVYSTGHLVKRISDYRPAELLAFDVIEQNGIEDRSIRLIRGSFRFESLGPGRTRVVLTTEYVPLLQARLVWRPFERRLAHMLHEHVLFGIELEAERRSVHLLARNTR